MNPRCFVAPMSKVALRSELIRGRVRRVKCGEEKPSCLRCTKFGILCDGYNESKTQPAVRWRPITRPKTSTPSEIVKDPSLPLFRHERDSKYFEIFCSRTAAEILPSFNSGALRQILLQASREESSIRHVVIALGALHVTSEQLPDARCLTLDGRKPNHTEHQLNALIQYSTAIKQMRVSSSNGQCHWERRGFKADNT